MKISGKLLVSIKQILIVLFTLEALCIGWAASTPGSTLSNSFTLFLVTAVRYIVLGLTPILLLADKSSRNLKNIFLCIIPLSYYLFCTFDLYDPTLRPNIVWLLIAMEFLLCSDEIHMEVFKYFKIILVVMSGIGIVCYLCALVSIPLPHTVVDYYDTTSVLTKYLNYHISYVLSQSGIYRLCGLFNEPGYFGTVAAFILIADGIKLKKRDNLIIFIAGCLSFSMAFFALMLIYLAVSSYKKKWPVVILLIVLALYFWVLPNLSSSDLAVSTLLARFSFVDGFLAGDNRSTILLDSTFDQIMQGTDRLFGRGYGYWAAVRTWGTSSYKSYFVDFGIIGFVIMYGSYLLFAMRKSNKMAQCVFYIICSFASVYQRPNIFNMLNYSVLFGGIAYIKVFQVDEESANKKLFIWRRNRIGKVEK